MDDCIHGLDPSWCSICLHPSSASLKNPHAAAEYGAIFKAHYGGQCAECGFAIERGDMVRVLEGAIHNTYAHLRCTKETTK